MEVLVRVGVPKLNGLTGLQDPTVAVSLSDGSWSRDNSPSEPPLVFVTVKSQISPVTLRTALSPLTYVQSVALRVRDHDVTDASSLIS